MAAADFTNPASLSMPYRRDELILYLRELEAPDPRVVWRQERERGLSSDIDEVFHFFFDDNDFDESCIGVTLLNHSEVAGGHHVKERLEGKLGRGGGGGGGRCVW